MTLTSKRPTKNPVFSGLKERLRELESQLGTPDKRKAFLGFARSFTAHIDPEEETAFSTDFVVSALIAQLHTLDAITADDMCVMEVVRGSDVLRVRCQPDGISELESVFSTMRAPGTMVSIVSNDMEFLVDTFLQTIREKSDRLTTIHPILERSDLVDYGCNVSSAQPTELLSFFAAQFPIAVTKVEAEQLLRTLAKRYQQLYHFNRDRDRMLSDLLHLIEEQEFPMNGKTEPPVSNSAFSHFLPFAEIRRPKKGERLDLGITREDVAIDRHWPRGLGSNYHIQVLPARSEILDFSQLRAVSFKTPEGEVDFVGIFRPQRTGAIGLAAPEVADRLDTARKRLNLLPTSHSYRVLQDFVTSLNIDTVLALPINDFLELARSGLLVEEVSRTQVFLSQAPTGPRRLLVLVPGDRVELGIEDRIDDTLANYCDGVPKRVGRFFSERRLVLEYILLGSLTPDGLDKLAEELDRVTTPWRTRIRSKLRQELNPDLLPKVLGALDLVAESVEESYQQEENDSFIISDLTAIASLLESDRRLSSRLLVDVNGELRLHLILLGSRLSLSQILPVIENFGLKVLDEQPYRGRSGNRELWIIDLGLVVEDDDSLERLRNGRVRERVEQSLASIWHGEEENDQLNQLAIAAELNPEEISVVRALASYMRLTNLGYSEAYCQQALVSQPTLARMLVRLFYTRFDPEVSDLDRGESSDRLIASLEEALGNVTSLDQDKVLRGMKELILAMLRTNLFQTDRKAVAFKIDPRMLSFLPEPKPRYEIYMRNETTEAVHLRGGPVARGGIRFSDRMEDFRTEILGLMKAQTVKNAVIVPVGSKGGFIVKDLDPKGRNATKIERSYRVFMETLLSLTDNLVDGKVVPPERTVRHDGPDHYLVVAADKGTATFSDIANEISINHGYWLGDAFASGGSHGFDHKQMGITAKGAWVSVEHLFDAVGIDVARTPIRAVGIGDLSGDVFGNGTLRSHQLKLVAAFDHRHIFLDPDPEPEVSWQARAAIFSQGAGTSWEDYPESAISTGGGVFSRNVKAIKISPQVAEVLEIPVGSYEPNQLIRHILQAPVDLLFNGGIGTYVKASTEANIEVADKANDSVRVNGNEVRARVIGEGGNLGMTQLGRIEYCLSGGRCNTDSIDNSAGVDTSDHEVNIKIALDALVHQNELSVDQRNEVLAQCVSEVETQVLADNVYQNWALSAAEVRYDQSWGEITRLLTHLVDSAGLAPGVEHLPNPSVIAANPPNRKLTRAELSIIISYVKLDLNQQLMESSLLDHPLTDGLYEEYFPLPVRQRIRQLSLRHPLRRELIATTIANVIVNHVGVFGVQAIAAAANISIVKAAEYIYLALLVSDARATVRRLLWSTGVSFEARMDAYLGFQDLVCTSALELRLVVDEPERLFDSDDLGELTNRVKTVAHALSTRDDLPTSWQQRREFLTQAQIDSQISDLLVPGRTLALYLSLLVDQGNSVGDLEEFADSLYQHELASGIVTTRELLSDVPTTDLSSILAQQQVQDRLNNLSRSIYHGQSFVDSVKNAVGYVAENLERGEMLQALLESLKF
ncbi:NAD-glutamate dehydrogenase domain-containing protein [Ferrimicrobium acidiphilum]|uniref:NAD-glutamate dehydrogenase domain-containing protein n=1 Tax=Ferrimicrobium acidiphilum TaxID=121039 RepID=UPI0023F04F43|nr:NAD-glutamate dehydrogenase domain-containing protein [Ferrimicrobium acidiphilum]